MAMAQSETMPPPNPPTLAQHKSAPPLNQSENIAVPSLSRAVTSPTLKHRNFHGLGRQRFTDTTLDILLGPSQIERSPSSQSKTDQAPVIDIPASIQSAAEPSDVVKSDGNVFNAKEDNAKVQIDSFMSNFGVSTVYEQELSMKDPEIDGALVNLSVNQYTALHKSTGLALMVGDIVDATSLTGSDVSDENALANKQAKVIEVRDSDNALHVDIGVSPMDDGSTKVFNRYDTDGESERKWTFELISLVPRVAEEVWIRTDVVPIEPQPSNEIDQCSICLDTHPTMLKNICDRPGELGGLTGGSCDVVCCVECFQAHVSNSVNSAKFSVAPIRCPGATCGRRLSMERWAWAVSSQPEEELSPLQCYLHNPKALSTIRCPYCDNVGILFPKPALGEEARRKAATVVYSEYESLLETHHKADMVHSECNRIMRELETLWLQYAKGNVSATEVVDQMVILSPGEIEADIPEFLHLVMRDAFLPLIVDVERRCALHLAWLRKFPKIYLTCCEAPVCFKCKVEGHHDGQTCAERQAEELDIEAQYCPACGVATIRSEGCNHIVCVCGAHWSWEGEDY